jgi:hypothetical protein
MTCKIGHISHLRIQVEPSREGSKAVVLNKRLETVFRVDKQLSKLIETAPEYSGGREYNALNRASTEVFVASQFMQGCKEEDVREFAHHESGEPTPLDRIACLGKEEEEEVEYS